MSEMLTLKGRDLYSKVRLIDPIGSPKQDKNDIDYWRASYGKKVFIMREAEATDFANGNVAELTLEPTSREIDNNGTPETVEGVQYAGHLTYTVAKTIAKNEGELIQLENSFLVQAVSKEVVSA